MEYIPQGMFHYTSETPFEDERSYNAAKKELIAAEEHLASLSKQADELLDPLYESPICQAVKVMDKDPVNSYDFVTNYQMSMGIWLQSLYALPGDSAIYDEYDPAQIYRDLNFYHPVLRTRSIASLANQTQSYVNTISPKKRERIASQPEHWNFSALTKKYRERFQEACKEKLVTADSPEGTVVANNLETAIGSLHMTMVCMLMDPNQARIREGKSEDEVHTYALNQVIQPVLDERLTKPYHDGILIPTLMESYRQGFRSNPVDYPAIHKLNEIAGDQSHQYIEWIMIENIVAGACTFYSRVENIDSMRSEYFKLFHAFHENDTAKFIADTIAAIGTIDSTIHPAIDDTQDRIAILQRALAEHPPIMPEIEDIETLDWEVLPPGDLEKIAREIVQGARSEKHVPTIDLERLTVLENIRTRWGEDDCYYARGALSTRRAVHDSSHTEADQYLMLILQEKTQDGTVTAEHAIAESPIARLNAMYVFRQDVSENLDWRDVMSLPKTYARDFGARVVKHTLPRGETDLVGAMTEKVSALMSATPEEFRVMQFNGVRGIRVPRSVLQLALQSERDSATN